VIEKMQLKFGTGPSNGALQFDVAPITVFVGPNYSGKSKVISEIEAFCRTGRNAHDDVILGELAFRSFSQADANERIKASQLPLNRGEILQPGTVIVGKKDQRIQVDRSSLEAAFLNVSDPEQRHRFASWYLSYNTLKLDGRGRIDLVNAQNGGDLQGPTLTTFQSLWKNDDRRNRLSNLVYGALKQYLVIDPTQLGTFRLRLSQTKPASKALEQGLTAKSVAFHAAATPIENTSDGAKAFVGILAEIIAGDPEVLLIDEPEAFLHPSLALMLGREVAQAISATDKKMFVATHSPDFLMGCIQSGVPVNVVRLTYQAGVATARLLPNTELVKMMRNPLLRSTGVIGALFYESVIVTEADPDRAFYQEINARLSLPEERRGIPNCIFLNAQNKQTIPTIMRPLRNLGIPVAGIYDIDFVDDKRGTAANYLAAAFVPEASRNALNTHRSSVQMQLAKKGDFKHQGGVELLDEGDREAADSYLSQLEDYGIFVVRRGELENWLEDLGATGHGPNWLISIFEKMGEDPNSPTYVRPTSGDVWEFMVGVGRWLQNPLRKGIPQ
jgi:predicted ATPase